MPTVFSPSHASCSDTRHTAKHTRTQDLDRISLSSIQRSNFTGTVNVVAFNSKDMRMAVENSAYASCGQRLNGHCHLGKSKERQKKAYAAGQATFSSGRLTVLSNASGTYKACGVQDGCHEGKSHKNHMYELFESALGPSAMNGVQYHSYSSTKPMSIVTFVVR